ncbi:uncharacterized protein LOC119548368 isoform X1 [Drosophila subpulchrella]|uniref:uncharacterized protein LOC119548368 isoform X1 n=1 Tax=Drosophila subpulchrella TaxID=1486046 RepID=UPI0018A175B2|nr:uncharacterized protein LOC119548368 isoform X1 [Drosophila subpulchrella]
MSDQPTDGVARLRLKVSLWIYGTALVFILVAILLLILPGLVRGYPLVSNDVATYCFFGVGLATLCVYVNVMWLRWKCPFINYFIAACLAFGSVSVLSYQLTVHVLLLSLEILIMMSLVLIVGSFKLPKFPTVAYLLFTWGIFVTFSSILMTIVCGHLLDILLSYEVAIHFALWQIMFPLIVFQAQVISGFWDNLPPFIDKTLCSTMLLLDFLACYAFLDSAEDIGFEVFYVSQTSNQQFLARSIKSQWDMMMDSK